MTQGKSKLSLLFDHLRQDMIGSSLIIQQTQINEIAEKIAVKPSRVWIMLCDLQKRGLINKTKNPGQGAGVTVSLPDKSEKTSVQEQVSLEAQSVSKPTRTRRTPSRVKQKATPELTLSESINKVEGEITEMRKALRKKMNLLSALQKARRSLKAGGF